MVSAILSKDERGEHVAQFRVGAATVLFAFGLIASAATPAHAEPIYPEFPKVRASGPLADIVVVGEARLPFPSDSPDSAVMQS